MQPRMVALQSTPLFELVHERICQFHYNMIAETAYMHWVRFFIHNQPTGSDNLDISDRPVWGSCGKAASGRVLLVTRLY